mmetsp:Transcript_67214/g.170425  ORF Transcript_67214/g.170425 Transcript_67214/m.170425 type:complete len:202 (-) Transcript_67214:3-608(-)
MCPASLLRGAALLFRGAALAHRRKHVNRSHVYSHQRALVGLGREEFQGLNVEAAAASGTGAGGCLNVEVGRRLTHEIAPRRRRHNVQRFAIPQMRLLRQARLQTPKQLADVLLSLALGVVDVGPAPILGILWLPLLLSALDVSLRALVHGREHQQLLFRGGAIKSAPEDANAAVAAGAKLAHVARAQHGCGSAALLDPNVA